MQQSPTWMTKDPLLSRLTVHDGVIFELDRSKSERRSQRRTRRCGVFPGPRKGPQKLIFSTSRMRYTARDALM
ncbi:hypothetical protein MLPF_3112 [Mycobacterium lepromatosis]|nr:hypothetical protein MLPF_3112 [Mycobacterium lepromatosis]